MPALINGFPVFDPTDFEAANDELAVIFNMQRALMSACEIENLPPDVAFWVTETAAMDEILESLENFKDLTKPWKRNANLNMDAVQEEVVDQLFFLVQAAIILGMDSKKFFSLYQKKYSKNLQRIIEKRGGMDEAL
jgi:uncharacterized protein YabN with tetrapyrrole methylase and pyrophosphatase domain